MEGSLLENGSWRCVFCGRLCFGAWSAPCRCRANRRERSNNLVSDILLNAYISYNASVLKTWSRHSSGKVGRRRRRGIMITCCATGDIPRMKWKASLALFQCNLRRSDIHLCCSGGSLIRVQSLVISVSCAAFPPAEKAEVWCNITGAVTLCADYCHHKAALANVLYEEWIRWRCVMWKDSLIVTNPQRTAMDETLPSHCFGFTTCNFNFFNALVESNHSAPNSPQTLVTSS